MNHFQNSAQTETAIDRLAVTACQFIPSQQDARTSSTGQKGEYSMVWGVLEQAGNFIVLGSSERIIRSGLGHLSGPIDRNSNNPGQSQH